MKTKTLLIALFLIECIVSNSQTYHSNLWVDRERTFSYDQGISREPLTFVVDLIKLKLSMHSEKKDFLNFQNLNLNHIDSWIEIGEDGQPFRKSKYEIGTTGKLFYYIEDYRTEQSTPLGKYKICFGIQDSEDGVTKSELAIYINEKQTPIKYNPKTIWANYQTFVSNYRVEGVEKIEGKTSDITIGIDLINNCLSLGRMEGGKFTFIKNDIIVFKDRHWRYSKYLLESQVDFLEIFEADTAIEQDNHNYSKVFVFSKQDTLTKKVIDKIQFCVDNLTPIRNLKK